MWTGFTGSGFELVVDSCEHGNGPSGSVKGMELLDWLSEYWIFKDCSMQLVMVPYGVLYKFDSVTLVIQP